MHCERMMTGESLIVLFMFSYQIVMIITIRHPRARIPAFEKENVVEISAKEKKRECGRDFGKRERECG